MRRTPIATLSLALLISLPLRAQTAPPITAGRAVAQTAAGAALMPVGFLGGGLATRWVARHLGATDDVASTIALIGAYTTAGLTTAAGPTLVGGGPHASGSHGAAVLGTAAGGIGSILLVRLNKAVNTGPVLRIVSGIGVVLLPSIGATIGYNMSRGYKR
jgi:hypothetical protein